MSARKNARRFHASGQGSRSERLKSLSRLLGPDRVNHTNEGGLEQGTKTGKWLGAMRKGGTFRDYQSKCGKDD
ncbi:unnamed protein product [Protopolystoma xenopodis]|uniref:Uncharacterized protein n=1 Tax=Protopolystoma xenopodis TaxID=117903 RepID=A0A3S5AIL2_9PLAT|nr:unnamed protein product [Protopolystoma xenopodis]